MTDNSRSSSPISSIAVTYLERPNDTPCDRIKNFIDDVGDILSEIDYEHLKKFLKQCSYNSYNFRNQTPTPSIANCMNTMLRDKNTLDPNSKYYHYYDAMIYEFLQQSLILIGADKDHVLNLNSKINNALANFKNCYIED